METINRNTKKANAQRMSKKLDKDLKKLKLNNKQLDRFNSIANELLKIVAALTLVHLTYIVIKGLTS